MRIALLDHAERPYVRDLVGALRGAGHEPQVLGALGGVLRRPVDAALRRRGFAVPLAHVPFGVAALGRGSFDVAHAFSPADAVTALMWRRLSARPVVFTCTDPLDRGGLADRRLRLWAIARATEDSDAVLAASEEAAASILRWLAIEAPVIGSLEHLRLYSDLLTGSA